MLGYLLSKIRTDRKMSKLDYLSFLQILILVHLSPLKGVKEFQVKALREISKALDIPYKI